MSPKLIGELQSLLSITNCPLISLLSTGNHPPVMVLIYTICPKVCALLTITLACRSIPNCYHKSEGPNCIEYLLYPTALRCPFAGTKRPKPFPALQHSCASRSHGVLGIEELQCPLQSADLNP